ncbi:MAG: hypothetical protein E7322_08190 [Clostridiales bacterium]|nr:hypothetical protein [Clostridiales bacterium]
MVNGSVQLWDSGVWSLIVTAAILLGSMLIANSLRLRIKFLRRSLVPSSVIAGFLVLFERWAYKALTGNQLLDISMLETLTYHGLGIGFVCLALRSLKQDKDKNAKRDVFNTSLVVVNTYLIQAISGLIISIILFYAIGSFAASGMLLPMGFGQGPGQAYNWGHNYQEMGFEGGVSFGLSVAACGFIAASIGGVVYLFVMRKRGLVKFTENAEQIEDLTAESISSPNEIPMSESMDKLTVQFAMIIVTYALAYAFMWGMNELFGGIKFYDNTVKPLIWGFNFLIGTAMAVLMKVVFSGIKKLGIMKREYINNFMMNRVSGLMFDIMVVASIAAIDLTAFRRKEFVIPLLSICIVGAILTFIYCRFVSKRIFASYEHEAFLSLYGMLTGTASTGVILLREIDPKFETPASNNVVFQSLWAIVFGFPILLLMGYVAKSMLWAYLTLGIIIVLFVLMNALLFRKQLKERYGKK